MDGLLNQYDPHHPIVAETIQCLIKTFSEKDNVERTKSENRLKELENDILAHLKNILAGFKFGTGLSDDIKLSIVIYLKNTMKSKLVQKLFSKEDILDVTQSFLELILYSTVSDNLLQNLTLCLTNIFNSIYFTKDNDLIQKIFVFLQNYTINLQGSDIEKISKFKPMICVFQIIISSLATNKENIYDVIGKELEIVDSMILLIKSNLISNKENYNFVLLCVESTRYIMDFLFLSILKLKRMEVLENCKEIFINKFIPFSIEMVSLDNLISFTGNTEYDSMVNSMKAKSFQFISFLIQNEQTTIPPTFLEHLTKILLPSITGLSVVINEKLDYLSQMHKDSKEFPDSNHDILLFQIMLFLSRVLIREPVMSQFSPLVKNFALNVIFPSLISTKNEFIKMQIDGADYHNMTIDLIENHKYKTYKTAASFLLTKLCEKYDGLGNFFVNFSIQVIDYCMKGSALEDLKNYLMLNYTDKNSISPEYSTGVEKIMTSFPPETLIDAAMLSLLILSAHVTKSPSNLALLRIILETHIDRFYNINSVIIKDKLCLIYGTFLDELYQPEEVESYYAHFSRVMEFLFMNVFAFKENQGVAYQAAYALNQLIYCKEYKDVVTAVVRKIMPKLIEIIKEIDVVLYFDVLVDIVVYIEIEDSLMPFCKEVVTRILREIKSPNKSNKESSEKVFLNKCFHILRTVLEKNKFLTPNLGEGEVVVVPSGMTINEFESIIEPVVMYIKNPLKIDFDDEIIYLMINVLKNAGRLTNLAKGIFCYLYNYMAKNQGITEELFEYLNLVIIYDHERWVSSSKENLQKMINLIKTSIEESEEYENSPIYGSLLTQVMVQHYPNIPEDIIQDLFFYIVNETNNLFNIHLDEDMADFLKSEDIYIFSVLVISIYSFFINYPLLLLKILDSELFNSFMKWTQIIYMLPFLSINQSKIVIIGLCVVLSDPSILIRLQSHKTSLLNIMFYLLTKQKSEESKNLKKIMKEETECHFIDSEGEEGYSSEEEDEESNKVSHAIEYKKISKKIQHMNKNITDEFMKEDKDFIQITSKLKTPSKDVDEYSIFSRTVQQLYSIDNNFFDEWLARLGDQERNLWNDLIHTKRIKVEYSGNKIEVPRKTLKIKRNPNQN